MTQSVSFTKIKITSGNLVKIKYLVQKPQHKFLSSGSDSSTSKKRS